MKTSTLNEIAEEHSIDLEEIRDYLAEQMYILVYYNGMKHTLVHETPPSEYQSEERIAESGLSIANIIHLNAKHVDAMSRAHRHLREMTADQRVVYDRAKVEHSARNRQSEFYLDCPLFGMSDCTGGEEYLILYRHPVHTPETVEPADRDDYRHMSAPYVMTFGEELFPGDRKNGLVHESVVHRLD